MKKRKIAAILAICLSGLPFVFLWTGCSSSPSSPAPTPTPAFYVFGYIERDHNGNTGNNNDTDGVDLLVNGQAVTDASVVLDGNFTGAPLTLASLGTGSASGTIYGNYSSPLTYQAGKTYILSVTSLGLTAGSTIVAPGNISASNDANGATTLASWTDEGNADRVYVDEYAPGSTRTFDTSNTTADADSPVTIDPSTAYPDGSSSAYDINIRITTKAGFTNALSNSNFTIDTWHQRGVTLP